MKKLLPIAIFMVFVSKSSFSQQKVASFQKSVSQPTHSIDWRGTIDEDIQGIGKRSVLKFSGAQYDYTRHLLPVYVERRKLPTGTRTATASVMNAVYQPLNDAEQLAVQNSAGAGKAPVVLSEPQPEVTVSWFKKQPYAYIQLLPLRKNNSTGKTEKLVSFSLQVIAEPASGNHSATATKKYAASSVLAAGTWHKVAVATDGLYKMDRAFLKSLGVEVDSLDPKNIRVYGNGGGQLPFANAGFRYDDLQENAIFVMGEADGKFDSTDYVVFYGQGQHRWKRSASDGRFHHQLNIYSDTTYYFINTDLGPGKRVAVQSSSALSPTHTVTSFDDYQFHETEGVNLLKSGRVWFGETFDIITNYNFVFNFPNIDAGTPVYARVEVAARADNPGTNFSWSVGTVNGSFNVMGVNTSDIYGLFYRTVSDTILFPPTSGSVPVSVSKITPSPSLGWLNHIELNVRRMLMLNGDQTLFRDWQSVGAGNIAKYVVSGSPASLQVWEVTDPVNCRLQQGSFSGTDFEFTLPADSLLQFVAFNSVSFLIPGKRGEVPNQDLHGLAQQEFLIVTNPLFLEQANTLADMHRNRDNMSVAVVTTDQVYNEFSSGSQDVSAIRDFMRMFYERAQDSTELPKYLLLFGRGSYDLRSKFNNTNFVPAYQSLTSDNPITSYPSDDFFGMLDSTEGAWDYTPDLLDLGVGRFPVHTASEANRVLNKLLVYTSVPGTIDPGNSCNTDNCYGVGDWQNWLTFIADDEDGSDHMEQAESLALQVDTIYNNYNLDKIYLDAYQQVSTPGGEKYPDAEAAFLRRMEKGSLIVNYTGHGGELGWAHERLLEIYHINSWTNKCRLPLFFTATCEFSRWDDPGRVSAGELTFVNTDGGSIGLMSTTRVVYSGPNFVLNQKFYNHTFAPLPNGTMPRLGDLQMLTKNDMAPSQVNHRNFTLLADPALRMSYPEYNVVTTMVNGIPASPTQPDTAMALSTVTVRGEVRDKNGNTLTGFNGIVFPTVFDKAAKISTLGNDVGSPVIQFLLQKNTLFKGKASVTNGEFSFTFIVPKDIAYNFGKGRISYYAHDGYEIASGAFEDFIVGGTDTTAVADTDGPEVRLFMNDEKFIYGGITNANPKIFAIVSDSNGVNTAGSSIGHDITAVLDGNQAKPFVLNDYYESDMDEYKRGTVRYPLFGLSEGSHTLTVKVWDVYNNSSTGTTEFVVASSAELALKHVLNYPNPFTTRTAFFFEHNLCCTTMDVQVQVFTVSGKLVKTIQQQVNLEGFRSDPIEWDGTDDFGDKIGRGVYIYRLRVKAESGEYAEQLEKLVVLK